MIFFLSSSDVYNVCETDEELASGMKRLYYDIKYQSNPKTEKQDDPKDEELNNFFQLISQWINEIKDDEEPKSKL